jgi:hypothetical protein
MAYCNATSVGLMLSASSRHISTTLENCRLGTIFLANVCGVLLVIAALLRSFEYLFYASRGRVTAQSVRQE